MFAVGSMPYPVFVYSVKAIYCIRTNVWKSCGHLKDAVVYWNSGIYYVF